MKQDDGDNTNELIQVLDTLMGKINAGKSEQELKEFLAKAPQTPDEVEKKMDDLIQQTDALLSSNNVKS